MNKIFNHNSQKDKRRKLRQHSTKAERDLWQNLRSRGLEGYKFRRQVSVGFFVLDFYCPELKLAIEVDGYTHDSDEAKKYDAEREEIIETYGVRLRRLTGSGLRSESSYRLSSLTLSVSQSRGNVLAQ